MVLEYFRIYFGSNYEVLMLLNESGGIRDQTMEAKPRGGPLLFEFFDHLFKLCYKLLIMMFYIVGFPSAHIIYSI